MAVFGLPGGAEWAIIALMVVFLFVPGALLFWLGFLSGRRTAARRTDANLPAQPAPVTSTGTAPEPGLAAGDDSGRASVLDSIRTDSAGAVPEPAADVGLEPETDAVPEPEPDPGTALSADAVPEPREPDDD